MNKHIRSPYFIPPTLNNGDLAWIFMGAPGPGASIHVSCLSELWSVMLVICITNYLKVTYFREY